MKHPRQNTVRILWIASVATALMPAAYGAGQAASPKGAAGNSCSSLVTPSGKPYSKARADLENDVKTLQKGQAILKNVQAAYKANCLPLATEKDKTGNVFVPQLGSSGQQILEQIAKQYDTLGKTLQSVKDTSAKVCDYMNSEQASVKNSSPAIQGRASSQVGAIDGAKDMAHFSAQSSGQKSALASQVLDSIKQGYNEKTLASAPKTSGSMSGNDILLLGNAINLQNFVKSKMEFLEKQGNSSLAARSKAVSQEDQSVARFKNKQQYTQVMRWAQGCRQVAGALSTINQAGQSVAKDLAQARADHTALQSFWKGNQAQMTQREQELSADSHRLQAGDTSGPTAGTTRNNPNLSPEQHAISAATNDHTLSAEQQRMIKSGEQGTYSYYKSDFTPDMDKPAWTKSETFQDTRGVTYQVWTRNGQSFAQRVR